MASFRLLIISSGIFLLVLSCTATPQKNTTTLLPQMSVAEGKVITARELSVWEFSKTRQFDKLREIMADDYIGYFATGKMHPSDVINLLKSTSFISYHLSNIQVKPVTENTAIIYYDVVQDVTGADGIKWVPQVQASSVYVKRNGVWYTVFYQEMPVN